MDRLRAIAVQNDRSMNSVINDLVRKGLNGSQPETPRDYVVQTLHLGLRPEYDPERLTAYLAELDDAEHDHSRH